MSKHHKIHTRIEKRVKTALSYYPQLDNINIDFKVTVFCFSVFDYSR